MAFYLRIRWTYCSLPLSRCARGGNSRLLELLGQRCAYAVSSPSCPSCGRAVRTDTHRRQRDVRLGNGLFAHCRGILAGGDEGVGGVSGAMYLTIFVFISRYGSDYYEDLFEAGHFDFDTPWRPAPVATARAPRRMTTRWAMKLLKTLSRKVWNGAC